MVDNTRDILRKYGSMIEKQMKVSDKDTDIGYSKSYASFKQEMAPSLSGYEKWCKSLGSVIKLNVAKKDEEKIRQQLSVAHLDIEPWQALTLSIMAFMSVFFIGLIISVAIPLIKGSISEFPVLFFFLSLLIAMFLFYYFNSYPKRLANQWRLKASSQMVPAILYVVVYMRHTSNLEKAIAFASQNLQYPLALDFKKVFYDMQIGKFSTIKESLDSYLETWRDYSPEFIESFHLVESSLFEPDNARRIQTLEKALQVILDGVYDKMLKFTHEVRSPLNNVYMLAVILPVLGIALLPLASAMLGGMLKYTHIFLLYNLLIPFAAFFMLTNILLLRPGGHGETGLLERNPLYAQYKSRTPYYRAFFICLPLFLIGLLPLIFQYTPIPDLIGLQKDYTFTELGLTFFGDSYLFDFKELPTGGIVGPFGIGALFFGLFFPLAIALFFSMVYKQKTKELIIEREKTNELEAEFNNSLFQLGNRLGNGMPPELVFAKVAESARGLRTEDFFKRVNYNIQQMGMSVEGAIFDPRRGAITFYPSNLIATSMRVLVESVKKGLNVAAISLMSISQYVKNIQKITSRLRDLLAEVISEMKSNMTFLAPLLLGIVVGLAAMITAILNKLQILQVGGEGAEQLGGMGDILSIFDIVTMIPPYFLQIAVGIYLVEIIFILTGALVSIDSGEDRLEKMNKTGKNLRRGVMLYFIIALLSTIVLFLVSTVVLSGITS